MNIDPNKFTFTFESQGTTFLFEDLCASYYLPDGSIETGERGRVRTYCASETVQELQKRVERTTPQAIQREYDSFKTLQRQGLSEIPWYREIEFFSEEEARQMFNLIENLFKYYFLFDSVHWDTAYAKAATAPHLQEVVELVGRYKNLMRADLEPIMFEPGGYYPTLLARIEERTGIAAPDLEWYREGELYELLSGTVIPEEEVSRRKEAYAFYKQGTITLFSGPEARELIAALNKQPSTNTRQLTGTVAHAAGATRVTGRVRLITRDYSDPSVLRASMARMEEGEILVSQSTDPELVDAIKKAGAVVTDVGGMLSHAAITARELDIPCVVGTANATAVLRDGDEVEVDTATGTVTIIQSV